MITFFKNTGMRINMGIGKCKAKINGMYNKAVYLINAAKYKFCKLLVVIFTGLFGVQNSAFALSLGEGSAFFQTAISTLQVLVIALGVGLGAWGVINLLEGYGNDNPGAKSQGMKQLMAGAGVAVVGAVLIPQMNSLFT